SQVHIRNAPSGGWFLSAALSHINFTSLFSRTTQTLAARWWAVCALSLANLISHAALAPGWLDADLGSPALAGSASYTNGIWSISAGGTDICSSDQLHFAWKPLSGDAV